MVCENRAVLRLIAALAGLALLASLGAGCGGDDDEGDETTDPQTYAGAVCTTIGDWVGAIQDGAQEAFQLPAGATPQDGKDFITSFIGDASTETTTARDSLAEAGAPDVDGGPEIADALVSAFDEAVAIFEQASEDAEAIPTDSPQAFQQAATDLGGTIQTSLQESGAALNELEESEELSSAAREAPECQDLASGLD
jgi:hypothetical protein